MPDLLLPLPATALPTPMSVAIPAPVTSGNPAGLFSALLAEAAPPAVDAPPIAAETAAPTRPGLAINARLIDADADLAPDTAAPPAAPETPLLPQPEVTRPTGRQDRAAPGRNLPPTRQPTTAHVPADVAAETDDWERASADFAPEAPTGTPVAPSVAPVDLAPSEPVLPTAGVEAAPTIGLVTSRTPEATAARGGESGVRTGGPDLVRAGPAAVILPMTKTSIALDAGPLPPESTVSGPTGVQPITDVEASTPAEMIASLPPTSQIPIRLGASTLSATPAGTVSSIPAPMTLTAMMSSVPSSATTLEFAPTNPAALTPAESTRSAAPAVIAAEAAPLVPATPAATASSATAPGVQAAASIVVASALVAVPTEPARVQATVRRIDTVISRIARSPRTDLAPGAPAGLVVTERTDRLLRARPNTAFAAEPLPMPIDGAPVAAAQPTDTPAVATARPIDTQHREWRTQMLDRIETFAAAEPAPGRETRITLSPDALGEVAVRLRETDRGIEVVLDAAPEARALLAEAAPRLAELAESRGLRLSLQPGTGEGSGGDRPQPQPRQTADATFPNRRAAQRGADDTTTDERIA